MRAWVGILIAVAALVLSGPAQARDAEPRIVGGGPATIGDVPWQVAIAVPPDGRNGFQRQFCGGSLIASKLVVTAAHCVYENVVPGFCGPTDGFNAPAADFSVISGRTTLSSEQGGETPAAEIYYFDRDASGEIVAEAQASGDGQGLYSCETSEWDVALIELASPAAGPAEPIKIAGAEERAVWDAGRAAVASGWGATSEGGAGSDGLQAVEIEIIADSVCGSQAVYGDAFVPQTMVCAGELAGGKDTCQGDSGGPLVTPLNGGGFRLVGDTSFGFGCAQPNSPGVYGRLADNPLRSAMADAGRAIAGADVIGTGGRAPAPPQTTIEKGPKEVVKTKRSKAKARFRFAADEPASFECRLDKKPYRACSSPKKVKVRPGKHTFRVRGVDGQTGEPGPAAKLRWKVKRRG